MAAPDNPVDSVIRGQEYFRLKQVVQSPGDIYELNESTRAVYIGPDSDIAEARITYYNPSEPLGLETADISVNGPFVGRVDALLATQVPSTGQPARILVQPVDIVNNTYAPPPGMVNTVLRRYNIKAQIDLICALKTLPSIPQVRADKTFRFPNVPISRGPGIQRNTQVIVPIYGRRMITCQIVSGFGTAYEAFFSLAALQPGQNPNPFFLGSVDAPSASVGFTRAAVIKASDSEDRNSMKWDVFNTAPALIETIETPVDGAPPLPAVKGFADLLIVDISWTGALAVGTSYVDLFLKLSDRES